MAVRTAEPVSKARALVTEHHLRSWFEELRAYIREKGMEDILEDPNRFINADESNFMLCSRTGKVLGPKGWSNVYDILAESEKDTLTVLGTFAANGVLVPGMIIYPYVKPPRELVESVPEGWSIGRSDNGWMKSETFYEYVVNILNP